MAGCWLVATAWVARTAAMCNVPVGYCSEVDRVILSPDGEACTAPDLRQVLGLAKAAQ